MFWVFFLEKALSNPGFPSEDAIEESGDDDGEHNHHGEAPPRGFHAVDEIHSEDARDECGEHEDDGNARHLFHDARHVVVDDAGVGFHCGVKDVGVDVGGFSCLVHLNRDVFDEVGVQFIDGQFELQFGKQGFVAGFGRS